MQRNGHKCKETDRKTKKRTEIQNNGQIYKETGRNTKKWTEKQRNEKKTVRPGTDCLLVNDS